MIDINLNIPIDTTPTDGSTNLIDSNGVFDSLELSKLHDVDTTGAVTGNVLALDGSVWKPKAAILAHDGATYDTNAIQTLTAAEYAAIGTPNASTIYFIV